MRLGLRFTKLKPAPSLKISMAGGIGAIAESGLWQEEALKVTGKLGKRETYVLEPLLRNSGPLKIELTPIEDMPCQLTFFELTSELPANEAYGSRSNDLFQNQKKALPKRK